MTISDRVFQKLVELKMTQKKFSELTGIKQSTISEWKQKKTNPSADKVMIICEALDVSPYWLLAGTDTKEGSRNKVDRFVVDRDSGLGFIIEEYNKMDDNMRGRVMGYVEAIKELKLK